MLGERGLQGHRRRSQGRGGAGRERSRRQRRRGRLPELSPDPYDVVLFSRSPHHIAPLGEAVEHARACSSPAVCSSPRSSRSRTSTAIPRAGSTRSATCSRPSGLIPPITGSGLLTLEPARALAHRTRSRREGPRRGEDMLVALGSKLEMVNYDRAPYLYRYICDRIGAEPIAALAWHSGCSRSRACASPSTRSNPPVSGWWRGNGPAAERVSRSAPPVPKAVDAQAAGASCSSDQAARASEAVRVVVSLSEPHLRLPTQEPD